jgi:hypothetical protein
MPPFWLSMPGSLKGEPGEVAELPGTLPPAVSMSWHDWLGRPVPLGFAAALVTPAPSAPRASASTTARVVRRSTANSFLVARDKPSYLVDTTRSHNRIPAGSSGRGTDDREPFPLGRERQAIVEGQEGQRPGLILGRDDGCRELERIGGS